MKTYSLSCESAACNAGHSARAREAAILHGLPSVNAHTRDDAEQHARSLTSKQLAVTAHALAGVTSRGGTTLTLFACEACKSTRVYGNSAWAM